MRIFVKTPAGKTLSFELEPNHLISTLKAEIQEREGIPVDQQSLIYDGKQLGNNCYLLHYKIPDGATIYLSAGIKLLVKTLSDPQENFFWVDPHEHVGRVKEMIFNRRGLPISQQRMICIYAGEGTIMENGRKLSDYNIENSTVHVIWNMNAPYSLPVPKDFKYL